MGCTYTLELRNYKSIECLKTMKMAIFQQKWPPKPKYGLKLSKLPFWYEYYLPSLRSVQVIDINFSPRNQDNYKSIKRFQTLKMAIFDQKRAKNGLEDPEFSYF